MRPLLKFFNRIGSVLLALALAFIVWIVAVQQQDPLVEGVYSQLIPITRIGPDSGVVPFGGLLERVQVRIRAPQSSWKTLDPSSFTARLDLQKLPAGTYNIPVIVTNSDPRVSILGRQPEEVSVVLEPYHEKELPVRVDVTSQPPFSYYVPKAEVVSPASVFVGGAKQLVEQVTSAAVQLSLANTTAPFSVQRAVVIYGPQGEEISTGLTIKPPTVVVSATVEQRPGYRALSVLPKRTGNPAPGYRYNSVTVEPPEVVVYGAPNIIDALQGYIETSSISIQGATGNVEERVPLQLPEGVSVIGGTGTVLVRVTITAQEDSITMSRPPIELGLGSGLTTTIGLQMVEVVISGPVPKLNQLKPSDVRVILNLVGRLPGSYSIEPEIIVPDGLRWESIVPKSVPVEIRAIANTPITPTRQPIKTPTPKAR